MFEQIKQQVTRERLQEALASPAPHILRIEYAFPSILKGERFSVEIERYLDALISAKHYKREWHSCDKGQRLDLTLTRCQQETAIVTKTTNEQIHIGFCLFFCLLAAIVGFLVSQLFGK